MNILEVIDRLQGVKEGLAVLGESDECRELGGFIGLLMREVEGVIDGVKREK